MKRLTIIVLIPLIILTLIGCSDKGNDAYNEVQLDQAFQSLDGFDVALYKGTPLPTYYDDITIEYHIEEAEKAQIINNELVLLHPELGPQDITLEIILTRNAYEKRYTKTLRVMPQYTVNDFTESTVDYSNISPHFNMPETSVSIYQIDNGIPYLPIEDFLALVSTTTHTNMLTKTLEDNHLTYTLNRGETYTLTYDFETTTLTFNHSDFFSSIGAYRRVFSMVDECGALCSVSYQNIDTTDSIEASFNLGYYGMQFIKDGDTVYAPLALLNELFSGPYYDITYTGTALIGYDMLMLQDDTFLNLVYPEDPLSLMPSSYKAQTYHYLALVLDMFYGLDDYFAIDDFYAVLDPFETALLDEDIDSHYDGIVDIILALDERHSGIRYHGFYKENQVIDRELYELGPRVSELKASEIWLKDNYCEYESLIEISEDGTLARVRFNQFMEDAYLDFLDAVDTLDAFPNLDSVIIDVSCNSGGLLSILLSASGLFTDDEFTFSYINTLHEEQSTFSIISPLDRLPYTLYIQTSEFSYSAAHIFTTYIDAYDLATIIGQPTGGGAAAIRDMVLPNGSHIVVSSPLVFVGPDDSIIELSHHPDILIPYDDFNDLETIQTYLE